MDREPRSTGSRIGDKITVTGMAICGLVEGALGRSKVHFHIMLVKIGLCSAGKHDSGSDRGVIVRWYPQPPAIGGALP